MFHLRESGEEDMYEEEANLLRINVMMQMRACVFEEDFI